ncbi:MAG: hypothetical protein WCQ53_01490 [bacterium]
MRQRTLVFTFFVSLILMHGCSDDPMNSYMSRRMPSVYNTDPAPSETVQGQEATADPVPVLVVDQNILNCSDSQNCHLESIQDNTATQNEISSLIVADSELLTNADIAKAPAIKFQISNIQTSDISSVTYSYIKKDSLGNILIQTDHSIIYATDDTYTVPIHSNKMGSGVLTSAPYEQHVFNIKISTNDNKIYSSDITFHLSSHLSDPIVFDRRAETLELPYYKMDSSDNNYVIDSIYIRNTLPFAISLNGSIDVSNNTAAFISDTKRTQAMAQVSYEASAPYYYPYTRYDYYTEPQLGYKAAFASPILTIKVNRAENNVEELPATIQMNNNSSILSFTDLVLQGNEEIQLDLTATFTVIGSILGDHGQGSFYEGLSVCNEISEPKKCNCFYSPIKKTFGDQTAAGYYYSGTNSYMALLKLLNYPNCFNGYNSNLMAQQLALVSYPDDSLVLVGRHHMTNTSYTITSWLKGYETLEPLSVSAKTMETIDVSKGFVDYAAVDLNEGFSGYVPGDIN